MYISIKQAKEKCYFNNNINVYNRTNEKLYIYTLENCRALIIFKEYLRSVIKVNYCKLTKLFSL